MTSNRSVKRDLLKAVQQKGVIESPGNTLSTLCMIVEAKGVAGKNGVIDALDSLERSQDIAVTREGRQIRSVTAITKAPSFSDRTERSAQSKRERTFAKNVPSYLPDHLVTPVVVTHVEVAGPPPQSPSVPSGLETQTPKAETPKAQSEDQIELAHTSLLLASDEKDGRLTSNEAHVAIIRDLSCTRPEAHQYIMRLRDARFVDMTGHARGVAYIIHEKPFAEEPAEVLSSEEPTVADVPELAVSVEQRLLVVIRKLEASNADMSSQVSKMAAERISHSEKLKTLRVENMRLAQENERLKLSSAVVVDPAIDAVLRRYEK